VPILVNKPLVRALECMTISCPVIDDLLHIFLNGLGWEILCEGPLDSVMEELWGVKGGSAGKRFCVVRSPGANRGMVRLVSGPERQRTRNKAARWAGAEILVSRDIDELYERLKSFPKFCSMGEPANIDFSEFSSNVHRYFHGLVPGGTHLTLTMAVTQPDGREFPHSKNPVGHIFEVPLSSGQYTSTNHFYCETLGMETILNSYFEEGPLHDMWDIPTGTPYNLDIHKGNSEGTGLGGIEVHGCAAGLIDPEPASLAYFDGGACMVTYTSAAVEAAYKVVAENSAAMVLSAPVEIMAPPYNGMRAFTFVGPSGERMEVCEAMWS